ncbi:MAG TPA: EAL domain-containing protein, partial [Bradyrhizobium sp.]|nr:EAL domain-containing protein [Bradyrhizobium sp.]
MIRISTIFIAICMVLVAASLGLVLYSIAGISGTESAIVALTALTFLILYNAVSMRLRDRTDVGGQIADLSRGTADLARQVAEFGRRLAAVEGRVVSANSAGADRIQAIVGEINELGVLVKELAVSVAGHEDMLSSGVPPAAPPAPKPEDAPSKEPPAAAAAEEKSVVVVAAAPVKIVEGAAPSRSQAQILTAVKNAMEENRIDIYLQPMVTLPQRKVRFYEAVTRLRDDKDQILSADDFIGVAEAAGLIGRIDHMVMLRCVQVLRRLMVRNKDVGVFCNVAAATLGNPTTFAQCLDFLEAN